MLFELLMDSLLIPPFDLMFGSRGLFDFARWIDSIACLVCLASCQVAVQIEGSDPEDLVLEQSQSIQLDFDAARV
jgi:hypothetical protein